MRIQKMDIGLEGVSRWQRADEIHLPEDGKPAPAFIPQKVELEQILRRPSLDQQLTDMLEPDMLDADLLRPSVLSDARQGAGDYLGRVASAPALSGSDKAVMYQAKSIIDTEIDLDTEVRKALAMLLRA